MSVTYMLALEEEPSTYEKNFTALTNNVSSLVKEWILSQISQNGTILEAGCGPGEFTKKLAQQKNQVIGFDQNPKMISFANTNLPAELKNHVSYMVGNATAFPEQFGDFDYIISTFMLSELRPLEQQIFLRECWKHLKPEGQLILVDEFEPQNLFAKIGFSIKRWYYKKKLHRQKEGETHPLKFFQNYIAPIGFEITQKKVWAQGSIRGYSLKKINTKAGYYRPSPHLFSGATAWINAARVLFTGQIDHIPIEPGIYQSGHPISSSPVIVTANYEYTYFKVMRDLRGIDAWVLCVDSNGINVWCGARGNEFGNKQMIEAVKATGLEEIVSHRNLLLPQLAAGGVAIPELNKQKFPFKITYGPVWSKDLKQYLHEKLIQKPESMRLAKFSLTKRIEAGVTHTTFIMRKFLLKPSLIALLIMDILVISSQSTLSQIILTTGLKILGQIWINVFIIDLILAISFPIANFTPIFIKKAFILGLFSSGLLTLGYTVIFSNLWYLIPCFIFWFWFGFFSTLSFSGYTMASSPRAIRSEYPVFLRLNKYFLIAGIFAYILTVVIIEF